MVDRRDPFLLRPMEERDWPAVLALNAESEEVLAPMDEARLRRFAHWADLILTAEREGRTAGFLIALREGLSYESENYRWFSQRYPCFLYVDRMVIGAPWRGQGLGRQSYRRIFDRARETGVPVVTAEIDTEPVYNAASLGLHAAMGFREVGTQYVRGETIRVSLQARDTGTGAPPW